MSILYKKMQINFEILAKIGFHVHFPNTRMIGLLPFGKCQMEKMSGSCFLSYGTVISLKIEVSIMKIKRHQLTLDKLTH